MKIATINNEFVPTLIVILWDEKTGDITYFVQATAEEETKDEYAVTREQAEDMIYDKYGHGWDLEFVDE